MKHLNFNKTHKLIWVLWALSLPLLNGCAQWSSNPARVQANYGASVRSLISNQIYDQNKAQHAAAKLPDGMEGNKADSVLNGTYRALIVKPTETLTHPSTYGIDGRGAGTSKLGGSTQ